MIILTGCSSGLGKSLFDLLSNTNEQLLCITRRRLNKYEKGNIKFLTQDLVALDDDFLNKLKKEVINCRDESVIFINNAGVVDPVNDIGELDNELFKQSINVNFTSPSLIINAICNEIIKQGKKIFILNISSGAAIHPLSGWASYCSTKAAMKMFLDCLQLQNPTMVEVKHFDPGVMDTQMQEKIRTSNFLRKDEFISLKEEGRLRKCSDVAIQIVTDFLNKWK